MQKLVEQITDESNTITEYDFAGWRLTTTDLNYLAEQGVFNRLRVVWMINVGLGAVDITPLCQALQQPTCAIRWLNLNYNALTLNQILQLAGALQVNRSVEAIYLQGNTVGDAGATALATMLRNNATLLELHLNGHFFPSFPEQIGHVGVQQLCMALRNDQNMHNRTLQQLNLWGNYIGDVGAQYLGEMLQHNQTIEFVGLGRSGITHVGAGHLATGLQNNDCLRAMDLRFSQLGDAGVLALAAGLRQNRRLLYLNIMNCGFTDVALSNLNQNGLLDNLFAPNAVTPLIYICLQAGDVRELIGHNRPWRFGTLLNLGWSALNELRQTGLQISLAWRIVRHYYSAEANHNKISDPVVQRLRTRCCELLIRFLEQSNVTYHTINECAGRWFHAFDRMRLRTALKNQNAIVCAMIENNSALLTLAHTVWGRRLTELQQATAEKEQQLEGRRKYMDDLRAQVQSLMQRYRSLYQRNDELERLIQSINVDPQNEIAIQAVEEKCILLEQRNQALERAYREKQDVIHALEEQRDTFKRIIMEMEAERQRMTTQSIPFNLLTRTMSSSAENGSAADDSSLTPPSGHKPPAPPSPKQ